MVTFLLLPSIVIYSLPVIKYWELESNVILLSKDTTTGFSCFPLMIVTGQVYVLFIISEFVNVLVVFIILVKNNVNLYGVLRDDKFTSLHISP